ncbi:conserved hypothetical protein [Pantoea brenneri]|uniref:NADH:flavin oxidoreductase/NADH oxidase N-terminal domain-containing protein n=1 Tax=Pantoea brenneri TaxID=472694 RepID=A0AAX3JA65_9GAMM|nr:conserved hypothetical protein [Pantoea brenneri]
MVSEVVSAVGTEQRGVRISPNGEILGVNDTDPVTLFTAAARRLDEIGIAYLEVRESPDGPGMLGSDKPPVYPEIRQAFSGTFIMNNDFSYARATRALADGEADAVSFGRDFISNPDLPHVFRQGKMPVESNVSTWYSAGEKGYTEYHAI